jgi:pyruvate formate lyase activating enzyme
MEFGMTSAETLEKHHAIAKEQGLKYAYLGNVPGHPPSIKTYLLS